MSSTGEIWTGVKGAPEFVLMSLLSMLLASLKG
jgi:hypothetical protein